MQATWDLLFSPHEDEDNVPSARSDAATAVAADLNYLVLFGGLVYDSSGGTEATAVLIRPSISIVPIAHNA